MHQDLQDVDDPLEIRKESRLVGEYAKSAAESN